MSSTQYGKYILKETGKTKHDPETSPITPIILEGLEDWGGIQHRMNWSFVSKPTVIEDEPHSHDFDEFICFLSRDPTDELGFQAEAELSLGREGEIQTIKSPSIVCIPEGLIHGPLNFKKVEKPVFLVRIYTAPEYITKPVS